MPTYPKNLREDEFMIRAESRTLTTICGLVSRSRLKLRSVGGKPLLRQSIYSRLAGYEDVNDAERLAVDPVMRHVVGGRAAQALVEASSTSGVGRFETEILSDRRNLTALMNLSGQWIDKVHQRHPLNELILDMDSSVSETYAEQEGSAHNGREARLRSLKVVYSGERNPEIGTAVKKRRKNRRARHGGGAAYYNHDTSSLIGFKLNPNGKSQLKQPSSVTEACKPLQPSGDSHCPRAVLAA